MEKAAGWREEGESLTLRTKGRAKSKRLKVWPFLAQGARGRPGSTLPGLRFGVMVLSFPGALSDPEGRLVPLLLSSCLGWGVGAEGTLLVSREGPSSPSPGLEVESDAGFGFQWAR